MSPELAPIILIGIFGYVACAVMSFIFPWFGFLLLVTIPVVKVLLRHVAAGLLAGYTYDVAVALLALISAFAHRSRFPNVPRVTLPGQLPFSWFLIAILLWGTSILGGELEWGLKKAMIFSIFNTMAIATLVVFLVRAQDARVLLRVFALAGVASSAALLAFGTRIADFQYARVSLAGASPLGVADLSANAVIVLIAWLIERPTGKNLIISVVCIPVCLLAIFTTGTRGPILGIPVLLPVLFWLYRRRINFQATVGSLVGLGAIVMGTAVLLDPNRLGRFSAAELGSSLANRAGLLLTTVGGFVRSPIIGQGAGSSSTLINDGVVGLEDYPHNHVIEVAYELGLMGLVPWVILMVSGFRAGWNLNRPEWDNTEAKFVAVPFYIGFLYHFLMTFKMGTFAASYMLYFYLCGTLVLYHMRKRDYGIWQQQMQQWHYLQQQQAHLQVPAGEVAPARALQSPR